MSAPRWRWRAEGSPCPARGCSEPRCVGPAVHFDGPGAAPPMGLHPVAGEPGAPAGGWLCAAGHEGWISSGECVVDLASFDAEWIEARAGDAGRGALAAGGGVDTPGSSHRTTGAHRARRGGN